MIPRSRMFIVLVVTAAMLLTSAFCNCPFTSPADPSAVPPISTAANVSTYTVNVSGEVIGTDFYLITADFKAELVNNRTSLRLLSEPFGHGRFTVPVLIHRDAEDNDTFRVRVLSLDGSTVYGETNVTLNDTADNRDFLVEILVVNPPPNYNGILIFVLLLVFALILAMYIFFLRWLIGRMILKRAGEIMINRQTGKKGGEF
ncbi:MAG TPA: hypothetical protein VMW02_00760 [Thermoplasmata archaeon]|nr:hypothetical protein [Thermoplasmata archaeon]